MLTHLASTSAETLAHWHTFRDPLIGLVTALVLALVGRFLRIELLATAAGGAGIIAGWYAITGSLWMTSRPASVDDLPAIAIAALIIGLAATRLGSGSGAIGGGLVAGVLAGWFLSGASRTLAQFRSEWPLALGIALAIVVFVRLLTSSAPQPLRLALAGLTMAASFHVVAMPFVWTELALVPGVASLALIAAPALPTVAALPIAADIGALGCLAVLEFGRLPRLSIGQADIAALSPLLALWLVPHTEIRVRFAGRAAPLAASLLAGAIAVGIAWAAHRLLGR